MSYELWHHNDDAARSSYVLIDADSYVCSNLGNSISEAFDTFGNATVVHHQLDAARHLYTVIPIDDLDIFRNNNPELFI